MPGPNSDTGRSRRTKKYPAEEDQTGSPGDRDGSFGVRKIPINVFNIFKATIEIPEA